MKKSIERAPVKLGIVGCGAIAESYISALRKKRDVRLAIAVDVNEDRACQFARKHGLDSYTTDYKDAFGLANAVVICAPNYLHAKVSIDFLSKGIDVLCEKPMATNQIDAQNMIVAAKEGGSILSIANIRRFYWSSREVKRVFSEKILGDLLTVDIEEGNIFSWPTKSGFFFSKEKAGGGVLMDIGSHVLDLLLWWCDDQLKLVSYIDDNFGGVESDIEMNIRFTNAGQSTIKLSRLRNLSNVYRFGFSKGALLFLPYDFNQIILFPGNESRRTLKAPHQQSFGGYFNEMLDDFLTCITDRTSPFVDPRSVVPSIKLIEECYLNASRFSFSWL